MKESVDYGKATRINLFDFKSTPMRAFHFAWFSFFLCFFGWFGIAPLMPIVREELNLTQSQIGNIIISSVAITIFSRLIIGYLVDKFGPRITYSVLLIFGSLPVMSIGLSNSYESFLLFRLAIGAIGASFVITQFHTSIMFAPNVVGTANATSAGWGNLGGGVTQIVMPLIFTAIIALGFTEGQAWRYAMVFPGVALFIMGFLYYRYTKDTPSGNFASYKKTKNEKKSQVQILSVIKDVRVWVLFLIYGACFGVELTLNNIAAIYFTDTFGLNLKTAGIIAGLFGMMNLFARTLGGFFGDKAGIKFGLKGRVLFLGLVLLLEGIALLVFAKMTLLPLAIITLIVFSLFVQMSEGATFSVVPFINKKAIGTVSGIIGAGGNVGAVAAGFLFKSMSYNEGLYVLGFVVIAISASVLLIKFSSTSETEAKIELEKPEEVLEPVLV
ncbi:MAG: MFS transporter [Cytophagaceae bacterium]